jgi:hypothetical protein
MLARASTTGGDRSRDTRRLRARAAWTGWVTPSATEACAHLAGEQVRPVLRRRRTLLVARVGRRRVEWRSRSLWRIGAGLRRGGYIVLVSDMCRGSSLGSCSDRQHLHCSSHDMKRKGNAVKVTDAIWTERPLQDEGSAQSKFCGLPCNENKRFRVFKLTFSDPANV